MQCQCVECERDGWNGEMSIEIIMASKKIAETFVVDVSGDHSF